MALINENDEQSARDSLGGLAKVVLSFPALRLVNPVCYGGPVDVLYGLTLGDGLGARFLYDRTSIAADNGVSVIAPTPTPAAGRWLRLTWSIDSTTQFVYKNGSTSRVTGVPASLDPDLQITLTPNAAYEVEINLVGVLPDDPTATGQVNTVFQLAGLSDFAACFSDAVGTATSWSTVATTLPGYTPQSAEPAVAGYDRYFAMKYRGMYFTGAVLTQPFGIIWQINGGGGGYSGSMTRGSYLKFVKRA